MDENQTILHGRAIILEQLIEVIASFIAGILSMPFLIEGYGLFQRHQLQKNHIRCAEKIHQEYKAQMQMLNKRWNEHVKSYNKKLCKIRRKLAKHDIRVETDENNNEIIVRALPVKMTFLGWLRQRGW